MMYPVNGRVLYRTRKYSILVQEIDYYFIFFDLCQPSTYGYLIPADKNILSLEFS